MLCLLKVHYSRCDLCWQPKKMGHSKPAQISQYTWAGEDNFRRCNSISQLLNLATEAQVLPQSSGLLCVVAQTSSNYNSILIIVNRLKKMLRNKLVQIPIDASQLSNSIAWDSVLTFKSWSPWYHFRAWLQLPPMRGQKRYQSTSRLPTSYVWQIFSRRTFEVTCMDLGISRKVC